jgi:hypothetical protein
MAVALPGIVGKPVPGGKSYPADPQPAAPREYNRGHHRHLVADGGLVKTAHRVRQIVGQRLHYQVWRYGRVRWEKSGFDLQPDPNNEDKQEQNRYDSKQYFHFNLGSFENSNELSRISANSR